jgi:uncharacterized RDD family membrane protein YckC
MGPVPRFFSNSSDPEVISLLGGVALSAPPAPAEAIESFEDTGGAAEDALFAEDEQAVAEEPEAEEPVAEEAEEPEAEEPVADAPVVAEAAAEAGEDPADLLDSLEELGGEEGAAGEMADLAAELGVGEGAEEGAPAEAAGDSGEEESVDDMWADAFAEQEAAESGEAPAAADEPAEEAGGDDDISNMWDEAFAEQDAAEQQAVAGETLGEADTPEEAIEDALAAQDEGELAEVDDSDLEKLWDEALEGAGDDDDLADELEEGDFEASAEGTEDEEFGELPAEGEDIVSQDDLDSLLGEAQGKIDLEAGAGEAAEEETGEEDLDATGEADPFGDEGEIEAFVDEGDEEAEEEAAPVAAEESSFDEEPEEAQELHEDIEATTQTRVVAGVVDTVLVGTFQGVFMLGTHFIVGQVIDSIYTNMEALILVGSIDLGILFLLSLFYSVYFIGGWGRTPGLQAAGLVVVDLNDKPVGYMQAVLRYFGTLAAILPAGLGQILTLIGKQGRGLGDRLAGTKVVFRASL